MNRYFLSILGLLFLMLSCGAAQAASAVPESMIYAQYAEQLQLRDDNVAPPEPVHEAQAMYPTAAYAAPSMPVAAQQAKGADVAQQQAVEAFKRGGMTQYNDYVGQQADAALDLLYARDYKAATAAINHLVQEFPQNPDVQYAAQQLDGYNKAELNVNAYYNPRSSSDVIGGDGYGVDADLYSAPIDYNWRLFAGTSYGHEDEGPTGTVGYSQSRAGVEYRDTSLVATIAPTNNLYHDSNRAGFLASGDWTFNKAWSAGGGYELFSRDTPLQALNAGVTANKASIDTEWRQDNKRDLRFDGSAMQFSDGNNRLAGSLVYLENLFSNRDWRLNAIASAAGSHNSGDDFRSYYNPKSDFTALIGPKITETLYHGDQTLYEHSLQALPGLYWQQGYGSSTAVTVDYGQALHLSNTLEDRADVSFTHQKFDSQSENNIGFTVSLVQKF